MQRFILTFLSLLLILLPFAAQAETSIAVVDVQMLLADSNIARNVEKQVTEHKQNFMDELNVKEQALRDAEKVLTEQRATLSKDEFATRAKKFEESLIETRRLAENKRRVFEEVSAKALKDLREKLYAIVQEIAKEKGFNLVISKQNVIVGEQSIDITDEVMKRLNATASTATLDFTDK